MKNYEIEQLNKLNRIFDHKSESYKFFWFISIMECVQDGSKQITFDQLINKMICKAWYMVNEYHLNLGPSDTLEKAVINLKELNNLKTNEKEEKLQKTISQETNKSFLEQKNTLTNNVPYRFQSPFLNNKTKAWPSNQLKSCEFINKNRGLIYYFSEYKGLDTVINISDEWYDFLYNNQEIVNGWIHFNLINYLEKRNPNVPGIPNKLYPPEKRNLNAVRSLWKSILIAKPIVDVYSGLLVPTKGFSIDHFVPWSYVSSDELWNLTPTLKSVNSSKSNNLPKWDLYFNDFCNQQYDIKNYIQANIKTDIKLSKAFETCSKEYLNNKQAHILYSKDMDKLEFANRLEELLLPTYQSAKTCGFKEWQYLEK